SWRQVSARGRWPAFMKAAFIKASGLTRRNRMNKSRPQNSESPSQLIDARIQQLGDWRGKMLSRLRALIKQADPEVVEEWKWRGTPVHATPRLPRLASALRRGLLIGLADDSLLQGRPYRGNELEVRFREEPLVERPDVRHRPVGKPHGDPLVKSARAILAQRDRLQVEIVNLVPHSSPPTSWLEVSPANRRGAVFSTADRRCG